MSRRAVHTAACERRYARLLRLYPAAYRRTRGAEMLATLLEVAADERRNRPSARETGALILGALRAHAGHGVPRSARQKWLTAFRVAALMLIAHAAAEATARAGRHVASHGSVPLVTVGIAVLSAGAFVAVLRHRYPPAVAATMATVPLLVAAPLVATSPVARPSDYTFWLLPLATALLLPLLRHRCEPSAGLLRLLPVAPVLLVAADHGPAFMEVLAAVVALGLLGIGLLWLAVDERVTMAIGLFPVTVVLAQVSYGMQGGFSAFAGSAWEVATTEIGVAAVAPTLLLGAATLATRRHSRV